MDINKIKKPDNVSDISKQPEVPEHSMGMDETTNQLIIKVDSGKFMDTVFEYMQDWFVDENGVLNYNAMARALVINGITRDPINTTLEEKEAFRNEVATPILLHTIKSLTEAVKQNNENQ